jgi:TolA-binding protein
MLLAKNRIKFVALLILIASLALTGCSSWPWSSDKEDEDLFFEEDFGSEFEGAKKDEPQVKKESESQTQAAPAASSEEDSFFGAEPKAQPSPKPNPQPTANMDQGSGVISGGGGFASVDQKTDKEELKGDVATLRIQQEELMFRVQELQKIVNNLEPRLAATQERVDASLGTGSGSSKVDEEIQSLKFELNRLNDEIATLKNSPVASSQTKSIQKARPMNRHSNGSGTPKEYNQALAAYKAGRYDESILLFQEMSLSNPPHNLKDNIVFWMGSNYLKLDMFDDAIKQFQTVLTQYPDGNKVHDSRYMLGVCYQKKGDTGRALDALEVALKSNPPSDVRQKIEKQLMEIK